MAPILRVDTYIRTYMLYGADLLFSATVKGLGSLLGSGVSAANVQGESLKVQANESRLSPAFQPRTRNNRLKRGPARKRQL